MNIIIDYQSRKPIYEQIIAGIENLVITGILKPNEQIESIRELACVLGVNPNTVKKAYDLLEAKGVIVSKSTKGTFINDNIVNAKNEKINALFKEINSNINELINLGISKDDILKKIK